MNVEQMMKMLSKYDPEMKVILDFSEGDGLWLGVERVKRGYISPDSNTLYYDPDDAIEEEEDGWGGELEEVVAIKHLVI